MPDWSKEIRAAIASLNLEPMREAEVVEELSQHLRDRYDEMLTSGIGAEHAYRSLLKELNDGALVSRAEGHPAWGSSIIAAWKGGKRAAICGI